MAKFVLGQSGNPSGRPRKTEEQRKFEQDCRAAIEKLSIKFILKCLKSRDWEQRRWAMDTLLDRGLGKAAITQLIDAEINTGAPGSIAAIIADAGSIAETLGITTEATTPEDNGHRRLEKK